MKTGKRRFVIFIGILLMTVGIIVGSSFCAAASPAYLRQQDRISVSVLPVSSQASMKLTEDDVSDIEDSLKAPVTWWGVKRLGISTEKRGTQADVYAVGGPFNDFHTVSMLYGSFLSRSGGDKNAIVLDSSLAWELFGTMDAVGIEVKLQDKSYIVTGISKPDDTLLGYVSESGTGRAYIAYDPNNSISISGMEASLKKSVPGKSMQSVKDAFGSRDKMTSSFLFQDVTEQAFLDAESSKLPLITFVIIVAIILAVMAKRAISGMVQRLKVFMQENYFRDTWGAVIGRIGQMFLMAAIAAGIIYSLFLIADFPFFLPARYIPGSFIDLGFYKGIIKSEAQAAIAALSYLPSPWEILHDAAMKAAGFMNMLSLAGIAVFAAGMNLLKDARHINGCLAGWQSKAWDIPSVWLYLAVSISTGLLLCLLSGLEAAIPAGLTVLLCFGISLWAAQLLFGSEIEEFFSRALFFGAGGNKIVKISNK